MIVDLLKGEKLRWIESVEKLKKYSVNIVGNCLLAAGMISYGGAFTTKFRKKLENIWLQKLDDEKILRSEELSLRFVMEDKLMSRKWNISGLPNDNLSIENGIIIFNTRKWPLMIDPQNQATIFLKRFGGTTREGSFQCVKASDPKMVDQVITAVKFGYWVLLENVGLTLDTTLEPIFLQQKIKVNSYIKLV